MRGWLLTGVVALSLLSACGSTESDFPVAIGNRTTFPITVFANGSAIGDIGAGEVGSFSLGFLRPTGEITQTPLGNLISPTPVSDVVFTARELRNGTLSPGQSARLVQHYVTNVEFKPVCTAGVATTADPSVRWACVEQSNPTAGFVFSPTSPAAGALVAFNAIASQAATSHLIARYLWDFGDPAQPASGATVSVTHTFNSPGTYNVTLTVLDDAGSQASVSKSVTVVR